MPKSELTPESVANAEKGEGISHVVIDILKTYKEELIELDNQTANITSPNEKHAFVASTYAFLADEMAHSEPFTLAPEELIAIWSEALPLLQTKKQRYFLAQHIVAAYMVQDLNDEWKKFPKYFSESTNLPLHLEHDRNSIETILDREVEVLASLDIISRYNTEQMLAGNPNPILYEIDENFGNGMFGLRTILMKPK